MSYIKRVAVENKTGRSPLSWDDENGLKRWSIERDLKEFWVWIFLGESLEKGSTRKHTKNRVARWRFLFWGNFGNPRWFTKRIVWGEFGFSVFCGSGRVSTWVHWGGGSLYVLLCVLGRTAHKWGDQLAEVYGVRCFPKDRTKGGGFSRRCNCYWRGVY
jgi:hypothetical protein